MRMGETFDRAAALYEAYRPHYCAELFADVLDYCPVDPGSRLVEVGIGTGQATEPFLRTGAAVTAVECGAQLAEVCRKKFAAYPGFSVRVGKFEELPFAPESVRLLWSATAFHWIPEREGYEKVFRMLEPGGVFARFANHPYTERPGTALHDALQEVYRAFAPRRGGEYRPPAAFSGEKAASLASLAERYGFSETSYRLYHAERVLSADAYIGLLGTYSDNLAMNEADRTEFFAALRETVTRFGGTVRIFDTQDLELARKPHR